MPDLAFSVQDVSAQRHAAVPTLCFRLGISQRRQPVPIQSIALQCQIRIDTARRVYKPTEKARLSELFGQPERWSRSLHSMLWTHAGVVVPAFETAEHSLEMPVACSFDFNLAATKYFHGLEFDSVPLLLLFSGSVFYRDADDALAMQLLPWSEEARFRLPHRVWQELMAHYYPNSAWLCLERHAFDALHAYKRRNGFTGFDEALTSLLAGEQAMAS